MLSRSSSAVSVHSGTADLDVIGPDAVACGSPRVAADSLCAFLTWISTRCFISQRGGRDAFEVVVGSFGSFREADLDAIGLDAAACGSPQVAADSLWPSCRAFRYASRRFAMSDLLVADSGLGEDAAA